MTGLFSRDPRAREGARAAREIRWFVRAKRYDEALRRGTEYLGSAPHNHDVLFAVGGIHYMRGRYADAIRYLGRALEIGSYDVEALLLKAYSHRELGQGRHAEECCRRILEVDPGSAEAAGLLGELGGR